MNKETPYQSKTYAMRINKLVSRAQCSSLSERRLFQFTLTCHWTTLVQSSSLWAPVLWALILWTSVLWTLVLWTPVIFLAFFILAGIAVFAITVIPASLLALVVLADVIFFAIKVIPASLLALVVLADVIFFAVTVIVAFIAFLEITTKVLLVVVPKCWAERKKSNGNEKWSDLHLTVGLKDFYRAIGLFLYFDWMVIFVSSSGQSWNQRLVSGLRSHFPRFRFQTQIIHNNYYCSTVIRVGRLFMDRTSTFLAPQSHFPPFFLRHRSEIKK